MNEIIYILINEAMPGYVKIGRTSANLEQRIRDLSASTSIPIPFTCFYACTVKDAQFVEHQLHDAFDHNRINPRREFFQIAPERVVSALKLAEIENVTPKKDLVENKISKPKLLIIILWSMTVKKQVYPVLHKKYLAMIMVSLAQIIGCMKAKHLMNEEKD